MSNKILVTDTLFIFDEHVKQLNDAGYEVERLPKPNATEEELCEAVEGKVGYILGGIEKVTDKVIDSALDLKVIVFTGTSWKHFVTGWESARQRGIKVASAPHANAHAVAEWTFAAGMAMVRNLFALGRTGDKTFESVRSIEELQVGIIGLGHIGERLAELFTGVGAKRVAYWNRGDKQEPYECVAMEEVLKTSDVVLVCVSGDAGKNWLGSEKLSLIKDGAIVTCLAAESLDEEALLAELQTGRLKAFLDWTPKAEGYKNLTLDTFYCSNESAAYNTQAANKLASDWATQSMINLLTSGADKFRAI